MVPLSVLDLSPIVGGGTARVPLGGVVPWLACAVIVWLLTGLTRDEWLGFGLCLLAATPVDAATRRGGGRAASPATSLP